MRIKKEKKDFTINFRVSNTTNDKLLKLADYFTNEDSIVYTKSDLIQEALHDLFIKYENVIS